MRNHKFKVGDKVLFKNAVYEVLGVVQGSWFFPDNCTSQLLKIKHSVSGNWIDSNEVQPYKGEQMNDKEAAKKQLEALKAEMQKLEEIINKPEKAGSLLKDGYFKVNNNTLNILSGCRSSGGGSNNFESMEIAQAYAEAFNTMLELRKCEGSESAELRTQFTIEPNRHLNGLVIYGWSERFIKIQRLTPFFSTKEFARAAIDKVGDDKIIKMFNTLHGIY